MLAIEMVLAQEPDLALLDEPTGALAPDLANTVLGTIAQHVRASGCAVLLVEQNIREAIRVAQRVYKLSEGILVSESL